MIWLRSAVFNLWFYSVTAVLAVGSVFVRPAQSGLAFRVARLWARCVLSALKPLCGISVVISGREHLPANGPALIASQHQSAFDTMVWLLLLPAPAYVLKLELTRIPFFGGMLGKLGMIAVDRDAGAAAIRTLLRGADAAVAAERHIVIFPEGTRAPPGAPLPLHPGVAALATRTRLPVIPVVTDSGLCWGRRAFRKLPGVIHVAIQPPLPAGMGRAALMDQLATLYAGGVGAVDKSVESPSAEFSLNPRKAG